MNNKYDLYCPFDIEKHKQTYINYLEIIIREDGEIEYAVPSHQEKLIKIGCEQRNMTRSEYLELCPEEYYFDYMTWLSKDTNCIAVWNERIVAYSLTKKQIIALRKLKMKGLYKGSINSGEVKGDISQLPTH